MHPSGDKADHNEIASLTAVDPIYQSPSESDSDGGREVYMVGKGEPPTDKTTEEIALEAEEETACATRLAQEEAGKRHNCLQNDSGSSKDGARDDAPSGGHHPKYNRRCLAGRERLQDRSQSIREELDRIEYQEKQVYYMPTHNALASRMIID
jgi:hypothetical protein